MFLVKYILTKFPKYIAPYLITTASYGAISKAFQVKNATVIRNDPKTPSPMLYRDRLLLIMASSLFAIEYWPIYIYRDLGTLELMLRKEYKPTKGVHWLDYAF